MTLAFTVTILFVKVMSALRRDCAERDLIVRKHYRDAAGSTVLKNSEVFMHLSLIHRRPHVFTTQPGL